MQDFHLAFWAAKINMKIEIYICVHYKIFLIFKHMFICFIAVKRKILNIDENNLIKKMKFLALHQTLHFIKKLHIF